MGQVNSDRRFFSSRVPMSEERRRVARLAPPKPYSTMVRSPSSRPLAITYEGQQRPMGGTDPLEEG
jgi:hypothetical protein